MMRTFSRIQETPFFHEIFCASFLTGCLVIGPVAAAPKTQDVSQREARERLAPTVMLGPVGNGSNFSNPARIQEETEEFNETVKRLRERENPDPQYAIDQYRRFLRRQDLTPSVGVQAAVKVARLRQKMNDFDGAVLTCDIFSSKYASDNSSSLLLIEKIKSVIAKDRGLLTSSLMERCMPTLVSSGPTFYGEITRSLFEILHDEIGRGDEQSLKIAGLLCGCLEEVYFRWLKQGTASHTWQQLEALETAYLSCGDQRRADELLPKAAYTLLSSVPTKENPEIADASIMAARWLTERGRSMEALELYEKVPYYGNRVCTQVASYDRGQLLVDDGRAEEAIPLLENALKTSNESEKARYALLLGNAFVALGQFDQAKLQAANAIRSLNQLNPAAEEVQAGKNLYRTLVADVERWSKSPLLCSPSLLEAEVNAGEGFEGQIKISSPRPTALNALSENEYVSVELGAENQAGECLYERTLKVQVRPGYPPNGLSTGIRIWSSLNPEISAQIPVKLGVRSALQASESTVFLGNIARGTATEKRITLSAISDFQILSAETGSSHVSCEITASPESHRFYTVILKTDELLEKGINEGNLVLKTDLALQREFNIPWILNIR